MSSPALSLSAERMEQLPWSYQGHAVHSLSRCPDQPVGPALLLVHGFGASTDHWRFNIPVLAERHEVHALDLLGFGRSVKPAGLPYGGALWRDQLVAYVQERIGRPTVLVGNSLGGYSALAAGAALGPLAAGVALLNAAGPFSGEGTEPKGWGAIARRTIGSALLKSPVLQRLLFENLRRPATIRRTLNQVYIDKTNVDGALVEAIRLPSLDPGAFGVFRTVFDIPSGQPLDELFACPRGAPVAALGHPRPLDQRRRPPRPVPAPCPHRHGGGAGGGPLPPR